MLDWHFAIYNKLNLMFDLLGLVVLGIAFPTCVIALASTVAFFLWCLATGRAMQWARPWSAFLATIRLESVFLVVGGFVIGIAFGKALYFGYPIVMAILTLCVGTFGFLYFLWMGIPQWMEWRKWISVIFPVP